MYIPDCFRNLGHTSKRTQMSQIWCDPDVPEFAQPPKHGMHLDSKKEIRILPICAHSAHHHWQLFRYMGQCMRAADKKKQKKNSDGGEDHGADGYYCGCIHRKVLTNAWLSPHHLHACLFMYSFVMQAVIQGMAWWKYVSQQNVFSFQSLVKGWGLGDWNSFQHGR